MSHLPLIAGMTVAAAISATMAALQGAATEVGMRRLRHRARTAAGAPADTGRIPDPERMLVLVLILNQMAKIVAIVLGMEWLRRIGIAWPAAAWSAIFGMGVALVIVADALPRTLGRSRPERTLRILGPPMRMLVAPLMPLAAALLRLRNVVPRNGEHDDSRDESPAEEEILSLVETTEESPQLATEERRMLRNVIEFSDQVAREVMTPRIDVVAIEETAPVAEFIALIAESGHSRIPVYRDSIDQIVGIVVARDLFDPMRHDQLAGKTLEELARPAFFVPETSPIPTVLAEMRRRRSHLVVVVDEYGGTSGILSIEDVVEEIVGEIEDEHDDDTLEMIHAEPDGRLQIDARCPVNEAAERIGVDLPEDEDYDTFGGYFVHAFGRLPRPGESITVHGHRITVEGADNRRIRRLRVDPPGRSSERPADDGDDG